MSASAHYRAGVARGDWQDDAAQRAVLAELDRISTELLASEPAGLFARLRARFAAPAAVRGLYLWGGVGRGKTFLIDLLYEQLPLAQKKRVHYHRFMREVQAQLKDLPGREDPLADVAETIAASSGLGYMAMQAREFMLIDVVVLSILIYALLGKLADSASRALERLTLSWHPAFQKH